MLGSLVRRAPQAEQRAWPGLSQQDYFGLYDQFGFGANQYLIPYAGRHAEMTALQSERNGPVGTCTSILSGTFSEIRFAWQPFEDTRAGLPFGAASLRILEEPWPGGTTRDLLVRLEIDRAMYGNSYWIGQGSWLVRLDPNRTKVVTADAVGPEGNPIGRVLVGYAVLDEGGQGVEFYQPDEVAHYKSKVSSAEAEQFTGVSWLSEILPDVNVDFHMTEFKQSFVKRGAIPGLVVIYPDGVSKEQIKTVRDVVESSHEGSANAFNSLHIGGGADVKTVGLNMEQLNLKALQGASETRIAAAAGVPAVVASFSEGLQGSQLNAGNYVAARRRFADITVRPLWRAACGAFEKLIRPHPTPRSQVRLWYEDRDVAFLQEDVKDAAEIRKADAAAIRQLVDGGYSPDSAVEAVVTGDFTKLSHTGNLSVQLQPADQIGEGPPDDDDQ